MSGRKAKAQRKEQRAAGIPDKAPKTPTTPYRTRKEQQAIRRAERQIADRANRLAARVAAAVNKRAGQ